MLSWLLHATTRILLLLRGECTSKMLSEFQGGRGSKLCPDGTTNNDGITIIAKIGRKARIITILMRRVTVFRIMVRRRKKKTTNQKEKEVEKKK